MEKRSSIKVLQSSLFVVLAAMTVNVYACWNGPVSCCGGPDTVYVGNPNRPDTVWVPGHYVGCSWRPGHYIKFLCPPRCRDVGWDDCYGAYRIYHRHRVVNPCPDNYYVGFGM